MRILNFGSLNLDYVYTVERFVQPGETLAALSRAVKAGGKGLNQSIALARAGAPVCHAGCIGAGGDMLRQTLETNGVDTEFLLSVPEMQGHTVIPLSRWIPAVKTASCFTEAPTGVFRKTISGM